MTRRYHSIDEALGEIDGGAIARNCRLVVSWAWWDALSETEREAYRNRCDARGVRLSADHRISRHFVEMAALEEPLLSSEYRI
jgi:hypothetical protein